MSLADAIAAAISSVGKIAGGTITYIRGNDEVEIQNVPYGRTDYTIEGEYGLTRAIGFDFHIPATELDFGSGAVKPQRNDVIEVTISGVARVFSVLDLNGHCYTEDSQGVKLRVHTKEVG